MAARRYVISLRVLKNIFEHEKINFVSSSGHVMFYLYYKHQSEMPNHFILIFFCYESANYYCPRRDFARKSKSRRGTLVACVYFKENTYS